MNSFLIAKFDKCGKNKQDFFLEKYPTYKRKIEEYINFWIVVRVFLFDPVRFDLCPTNPSVTVSFGLRHRWAIRVSTSHGRQYDFFFSFNYSSFLSTSDSRAKTPLPNSFECFFDLQRSFGNTLRTFRQYLASPVLEKSRFFLILEIFLPNRRGTSRIPPRVLAVWAKTLRRQLIYIKRSSRWESESPI